MKSLVITVLLASASVAQAAPIWSLHLPTGWRPLDDDPSITAERAQLRGAMAKVPAMALEEYSGYADASGDRIRFELASIAHATSTDDDVREFGTGVFEGACEGLDGTDVGHPSMISGVFRNDVVRSTGGARVEMRVRAANGTDGRIHAMAATCFGAEATCGPALDTIVADVAQIADPAGTVAPSKPIGAPPEDSSKKRMRRFGYYAGIAFGIAWLVWWLVRQFKRRSPPPEHRA